MITLNIQHMGSYIPFFKALLHHPRLIGAVLPSSAYLANEMVKHALINPDFNIVELGAGTGVITAALLKHGVKPQQIITIEADPTLAMLLRENFPDITVIQGDASHLEDYIHNKPVNTIISSLPLRSLPKNTTQQILRQIQHSLLPGGRFIQYTYSYCKNNYSSLQYYQQIFSKRIWRNIPPARVDVFVAPTT